MPDETPPAPPELLEVSVGPVDPSAQEIPSAWLAILEGVIQVNSFVEASIEVLKLKVGQYRERLVQIDSQARVLTSDGECLSVLKAVNDRWLSEQEEAANQLMSRRNALGEHAAVGRALSEILQRQTTQIVTTCRQIDRLTFLAEPEKDRQELLGEIGQLLDLAHTLRDQMQESTVQVLRQEGRLAGLEAGLVDLATGLLNRTGIEATFDEWWRADPGRQRPLCVALLDIDQFNAFNLRHSWPIGDRILKGLSTMAASTIRKTRGFDRLGRVTGQRLMFFLGDTGPRGATSAIERLRQVLAATTFVHQGLEYDMTVSCAVAEVLPTDSTDDVFRRLDATLLTARQQGPNRTALDEGTGPSAVTPPTFEVRPRTVRLQDE